MCITFSFSSSWVGAGLSRRARGWACAQAGSAARARARVARGPSWSPPRTAARYRTRHAAERSSPAGLRPPRASREH